MKKILALILGLMLCITGIPVFADDVVPVSYTHLDVYKRQGRESTATWALSRISAWNTGR